MCVFYITVLLDSQNAHGNLKCKVSEQGHEIKYLTKLALLTEISSASDAATPVPEYSPPGYFTQPQGPLRKVSKEAEVRYTSGKFVAWLL